MQIIGSFQIVTDVTSVVPTLFGCIALLIFSFAFRFLVLLYSLECAGGFRLCGGDHGLCPLDSHKPLKRLDRNFYMGALLLLFGSLGFVQCCDCGGLLFYGCGKLYAAALIKIKKYCLYLIKCLFKVCENIVDIFQSYGKSDKSAIYSCCCKLFICELAVCC